MIAAATAMDGIVMNEKYRDSEMHTILKGEERIFRKGSTRARISESGPLTIGLVTVRIDSAEHMGSVDFWPCSGTGCVFLPEADVINVTPVVKSKLCNLAKAQL